MSMSTCNTDVRGTGSGNNASVARRRRGTESISASKPSSNGTQPIPIHQRGLHSQQYTDASSRLAVANATSLMMNSPSTTDSSHLCLVCDDSCTCAPTPLSQLQSSSSSTALSKCVKTLSNVDKDTLLQALKQMSPRVFNSITQTLKKKKILSTDESINPVQDWVPSYGGSADFPSTSPESLLIIDNNISYDHQASFYNHLNLISANAASATSSQAYFSPIEESGEAFLEEGPGGAKRTLSTSPDAPVFAALSPHVNYLLMEELLEMDQMIDDPVSSEEYERVFSRIQPVSSSFGRRRPSIPPLKKIPKTAAFRNPNTTDPFINGNPLAPPAHHPSSNEDVVHYEKVTSWLSPSETSSLISALKFDTRDQSLCELADVPFCEAVPAPKLNEEKKHSPSNRILSGLLKDLAGVGVADQQSSCDEFIEIEFPGGYSDDLEDDSADDLEDDLTEDDSADDLEDAEDDSVRWPSLRSVPKFTTTFTIDPKSLMVNYASLDLEEVNCNSITSESTTSSLDSDYCQYSICNCSGICFCGAFLEVKLGSDCGCEDDAGYSGTADPRDVLLSVCGGDDVGVYDDVIAI